MNDLITNTDTVQILYEFDNIIVQEGSLYLLFEKSFENISDYLEMIQIYVC